MNTWGRRLRRKYSDQVQFCRQELKSIRQSNNLNISSNYVEVNKKRNMLIAQEEYYQKQRAKIFWLKDGDVNSKFFHSSSNSRKASNMIHCLEHDDDDIDFNKKKKRNLMLLPLISIPYFKLATIILLIFQSLIIYLIVFLLTTMPLYWPLLLRKNLELHFSI